MVTRRTSEWVNEWVVTRRTTTEEGSETNVVTENDQG
jgi:hypothetical protein